MQQIYRRTPMWKYDLQHYGNFRKGHFRVNLLCNFRTPIYKNTSERLVIFLEIYKAKIKRITT